MSSFARRNYGVFPQSQFGPSYQRRNRYNGKEFIGQQVPFAPFYPAQQYHQSTFNAFRGLPTTGFSQIGRYGMNTDLLTFPNQLDTRYRYNQYLHNINRIQNRYWNGHSDTMPLSTYAGTSSSYLPTSGNYEYVIERRYIPYPIFIGPGGVNLGGSGVNLGTTRNLEYGYTSNLGYTPRSNTFFGISGGGGGGGGGGAGGGTGLLPKIRMIFIPTQSSSIQQPCAGPLVTYSFYHTQNKHIHIYILDYATFSLQSYVTTIMFITTTTTFTSNWIFVSFTGHPTNGHATLCQSCCCAPFYVKLANVSTDSVYFSTSLSTTIYDAHVSRSIISTCSTILSSCSAILSTCSTTVSTCSTILSTCSAIISTCSAIIHSACDNAC
jgi:hypothetical protein